MGIPIEKNIQFRKLAIRADGILSAYSKIVVNSL